MTKGTLGQGDNDIIMRHFSLGNFTIKVDFSNRRNHKGFIMGKGIKILQWEMRQGFLKIYNDFIMREGTMGNATMGNALMRSGTEGHLIALLCTVSLCHFSLCHFSLCHFPLS